MSLEPQVLKSRSRIRDEQFNFMIRGGLFQEGLRQLRDAGVLPDHYEFHEYPKAITITRGEAVNTVFETETCKGATVKWERLVPNEETIIVASAEEEERVLSGGMTSYQIEEARQGLLARCHTMGIPADPSWSAVRLRRELGDALDAPAPGDNMARLETELANLRKMAAMQAEIDALKAQLSPPVNDEPIEEMGDTRRRGKAA